MSFLSQTTMPFNIPTRLQTAFDYAKTTLFIYVLFYQALKAQRHLTARGIGRSLSEGWTAFMSKVIMLVLRLPSQKQKVEGEMAKAKLEIETSLNANGSTLHRYLSLPDQGKSPEWIIAEMDKMNAEFTHADYHEGKLSGAVYHGGDDMEKLLVNAFQKYCVSNPLHPDVFPAVRKMEAEVVSMCLRMYNNPTGAGTTTSGGTESIIMAVKTHRDWARAVKGITEPEIVVPMSAHAAFDKAGAYLKIKVHTIPVDPITRKVPIRAVRRAINPNTIMLVGSAVNFPDGNMDDIVALGKLAHKHKIGMHVDCCLGSFIMPFLEKAGFPVEPFDFRVQGVTSISCDTHKYGFAPKGSSVVMYRDAKLRSYQYYVNPDWSGGVYASPSMAGSRPGSLIAGTWAAMQYMGEDGYIKSCKEIVTSAKMIAAAIESQFPELYVLGSPPASVVAFGSKSGDVNVLEVGDAMSRRGWHLNAIQQPAAVHIACTRLTVPVVNTFIADLKDAVAEAKVSPNGKGSMVTIYGLGSSSAVGPALVGRLATMFLDTLYKA